MKSFVISAIVAAVFGASGAARAAASAPLDGQSFAIGNGGAVCEAQGVRLGAARTSPFDRKWALICRDVNRPVGTAYSWRSGEGAVARVEGDRAQALVCDGGARVQGLAIEATVRRCRDSASGLEWLSYAAPGGGGRTIVVEGLAGYDSALRLALASIAGNRVVPGTVDLVTTGGSGSLAQARASLGEADLLIGQGYRPTTRATSRSAEQYFRPDLIAAANPSANPAEAAASRHEVLVNRALQLSNLGRHEEAARVFDEARGMQLARSDPVAPAAQFRGDRRDRPRLAGGGADDPGPSGARTGRSGRNRQRRGADRHGAVERAQFGPCRQPERRGGAGHPPDHARTRGADRCPGAAAGRDRRPPRRQAGRSAR